MSGPGRTAIPGAFERRFMEEPAHQALPGLRAAGLQQAVAAGRAGINHHTLLAVDLLAHQPLSGRTAIGIPRFIEDKRALGKELAIALIVGRAVGRHIGGDAGRLAGGQLLTVGETGVGDHGQARRFEHLLGGQRHRRELAAVGGLLCHLVVRDQSVRAVYDALHVVGDPRRALAGLHHACIFFAKDAMLDVRGRHVRRGIGHVLPLRPEPG